jgi:hypothetical protein
MKKLSRYPPEICAQASAESNLITYACEAFHSHFNSSIYTTHPNICMFIEKLKEIQIERFNKLNSKNELFNSKILKRQKTRNVTKFN